MAPLKRFFFLKKKRSPTEFPLLTLHLKERKNGYKKLLFVHSASSRLHRFLEIESFSSQSYTIERVNWPVTPQSSMLTDPK